MLNFNASTGAQTEGLLLDETIEQKLMGGLNDEQKVAAAVQFVVARLVLAVQAVDGSSLEEALNYVNDHITIQT